MRRYYVWGLILAYGKAYSLEFPRTELRFAPNYKFDAIYKGDVTNREQIPSFSIKFSAPHYSLWTFGGLVNIGLGGEEDNKRKSTITSVSLFNGMRVQRWDVAVEIAGLYGIQTVHLGEGEDYESSFGGRVFKEEQAKYADANYVYISNASSIFGVHGGVDLSASYRFNQWLSVVVGGSYLRNICWQKYETVIDRTPNPNPSDKLVRENKSSTAQLFVDTRAVYLGVSTTFF